MGMCIFDVLNLNKLNYVDGIFRTRIFKNVCDHFVSKLEFVNNFIIF